MALLAAENKTLLGDLMELSPGQYRPLLRGVNALPRTVERWRRGNSGGRTDRPLESEEPVDKRGKV